MLLIMGWGASGNSVPVYISGDANTPAWTRIGTPNAGVSMYWAVATQSAHTMGSWSSSTSMTSISLTGQATSPIGLYAYDNGNPTATITTAGTNTAANNSNGLAYIAGIPATSLLLFYAQTYAVDWTPTAGFTTIHNAALSANSYYIRLVSKDSPATNMTTFTYGNVASTYWAGSVLEIKS
jgi:hypothetical protein